MQHVIDFLVGCEIAGVNVCGSISPNGGTPHGTLGKGGTGILRVGNNEVAKQTIPHTIPFIVTMEETFDVGVDTRTGLDDPEYKPPFRFNGKLSKVTFNPRTGALRLGDGGSRSATRWKLSSKKFAIAENASIPTTKPIIPRSICEIELTTKLRT